MKFRSVLVITLVMAGSMFFVGSAAHAQTGTPVYNSLLSPMPPNVPSQPFQAQQTLEFGDQIKLEADTPRRAGYATVLMSDWALRAEYPDLPSGGWTHPITLNIYNNAADAAAHLPARSVTQTFTIPWMPVVDPFCKDRAWKANDGTCYHGLAFVITFDLRSLNYNLPNQFIYGIEYNTNTWGYHPIGLPGPYESLNVGLNTNTSAASVGTDVNSDAVYWNTLTAEWYADHGAAGVGIFRQDTNWTGYVPAVKFTTFALPKDADDCKNGAWQNLVRKDFTSFSNQGACVSYVQRDDHDGKKDKDR